VGQGQRKHIPQRTCVACRQVKPKRELIRLVHTFDGKVEVDLTGKQAGRGAYLCPLWDCWQKGLHKGRLERALRAKLSPENRTVLLQVGKGLLLDEEDGSQKSGEDATEE